MIRKAQKFNIATSFHGAQIESTFNKLVKIFGEPSWADNNPGKVSCEWELELQVGDRTIQFTIYDWKQYDNYPIHNRNEYFIFNIGTSTVEESNIVVGVLEKILRGVHYD